MLTCKIFSMKYFSVVPICGVLTHKDKINEEKEYQSLEKAFREGLGLPDNRFLLCTSYCEDYDKHHRKSRMDQRHPELDIDILKFMQQVSVYLIFTFFMNEYILNFICWKL